MSIYTPDQDGITNFLVDVKNSTLTIKNFTDNLSNGDTDLIDFLINTDTDGNNPILLAMFNNNSAAVSGVFNNLIQGDNLIFNADGSLDPTTVFEPAFDQSEIYNVLNQPNNLGVTVLKYMKYNPANNIFLSVAMQQIEEQIAPTVSLYPDLCSLIDLLDLN